jgi:hypothetical protein
MRRNSGIINSFPYTPSLTSASGVFDSFDAFSSKRTSNWPITKQYLGITVNSSTSPLTLNEGSAFTVSISVEGENGSTLYYTILSTGGTVNTGDFTDFTTSGSFSISSNTGSFTKTLLADGTSEIGDAFQVQIRTGSISGPIVLTSQVITIANPSFTLNMVNATYNEGQSPQFQFSATNWNSNTLWWRTSAAADDVNGGTTSSTFSYTSGNTSSNVPYTLKQDMIAEGNETHTISVYDSTNSYLLASTTYTAVDTSVAPTFVISPSTSVNEGDTVTFTVTFANGPTSGNIYWGTTGTAVASDFTDNTLTGSFGILTSGSNGTVTITRTIRRDFITDGSKTFAIVLYRDAPGTTLVATSATVTIADTCQLPTVSPSSISINEGDTVTFTVNTTNVVNGTVFPVKMSLVSSVSGSGNTTDFSDNTLDTSVTITGNTGTFTRTWASDTFTEGTEVWKANLYYPVGDLLAGQILTSSANITVGDTSTGTAEVAQALYSFTSFTFTNAGATGAINTGPTRANCLASYNTTTYPWLNNTAYFNVVTQGIQLWTVPQTGTYRITAIGAAGGVSYTAYGGGGGVAGLGARMVSTFSLTSGQKLKILVGQAGAGTTTNSCGSDGGGGGGTFVATDTNTAMLVAGGGGGAGSNGFFRDLTLKNATENFFGNKGSGTTGGAGGTNGGGGFTQVGSCVSGGAAGAGFTGNGATDGQGFAAQSFINGGTGGSGGVNLGGFGGGGASGTNYAGGGGGGYSGGGGGGLQTCSCNDMGNGGGGACYSSTTYTYTGSIGTANGSVLIELI